MNYPQKNRTVLKLYWICTAFIVCWEILYLIYFHFFGFPDGTVSAADYVKGFVVLPAVMSAALGLALSLLCCVFLKTRPAAMAGVIMAGLVLFVNIIAFVHYGVAVVFVIYLFPILLSLFYNNRRMTLLTSFFVLASYIVLTTAYLPARNPLFVRHNEIDIVAMPVIIILATLIGMGILDVYSDLTDKIIEQTVKKIALERQAKEDSLTRLYNHAVFYESLDFAVSSYHDVPTPFCLIVMDIDNFKVVNDTYGHAFGDLALLKFTSVILARIGENDMAFRYGGEEFSIISFRALDETVRLAEEIRADFSKARLDEHPEASFTVSAGVCLYSNKYDGKREFFASADNALYTAKKQGKNRTVVADGDFQNDRECRL